MSYDTDVCLKCEKRERCFYFPHHCPIVRERMSINTEYLDKLKSISISSKATPTRKRGSK